MSEEKKYYRVDKIRILENDDGTTDELIHRSRKFETLKEAEEYFGEGSTVWKMELYEVHDKLLRREDPLPEKPMTSEEKEAFQKELETLFRLPNCS